MKRCLNCNALIRDDDRTCPYCDNKGEQFEDISKYFNNTCISSEELEKSVIKYNRILTPNEIREIVGLERKGEK